MIVKEIKFAASMDCAIDQDSLRHIITRIELDGRKYGWRGNFVCRYHLGI